MIRASFSFDSKKFADFVRYIDGISFAAAEGEVGSVADKSVQVMREKISSSKKRHSFGSNLEDNIDWTELINNPGVELEIGIGNITQLKSNAPYFEVLNSGGYVPYSTVGGAPLGTFEGDRPSSISSSTQNWERSGDKGFFMRPKKPIEGIGYIEDGMRTIEREIANMLKKIGVNFITSGGGKYIAKWGKVVHFNPNPGSASGGAR